MSNSTDPRKSSTLDPGVYNSNSRWVRRLQWPYPFKRFGDLDPISRTEEQALGADYIEDRRIQEAVSNFESWSTNNKQRYIETMESIDSIEYDGEEDGETVYKVTMAEGETYFVQVETYYGADHSLIARANNRDAPTYIVDAVEKYVQEEYDS